MIECRVKRRKHVRRIIAWFSISRVSHREIRSWSSHWSATPRNLSTFKSIQLPIPNYFMSWANHYFLTGINQFLGMCIILQEGTFQILNSISLWSLWKCILLWHSSSSRSRILKMWHTHTKGFISPVHHVLKPLRTNGGSLIESCRMDWFLKLFSLSVYNLLWAWWKLWWLIID